MSGNCFLECGQHISIYTTEETSTLKAKEITQTLKELDVLLDDLTLVSNTSARCLVIIFNGSLRITGISACLEHLKYTYTHTNKNKKI